MKTLVQYILEKQGIFNGCEDIANELVMQIVKETKKMKKHGFNFSFLASKYNPIFENPIEIDVQYMNRSKENSKIIAYTDIDEDKLLNYYTGDLILSDDDIDDLLRKPFKISIKADLQEIDLYDLKGIIMHELTHFYAAIIFYNKNENYFDRRYYSPDDWDDKSEYLLYLIQKDETNSIVTEFKSFLDKIKRNGFDDIFNELRKDQKFSDIIEFRNIFNQENRLFSFQKVNMTKYVDLYRKYFNCKYTEHKIYLATKEKLNNAYNQLYKNIVKMIYEYDGNEDFIKDNFDDHIFKPYHYFPEFKQRRREDRK